VGIEVGTALNDPFPKFKNFDIFTSESGMTLFPSPGDMLTVEDPIVTVVIEVPRVLCWSKEVLFESLLAPLELEEKVLTSYWLISWSR
jgi:hypothetical protein